MERSRSYLAARRDLVVVVDDETTGQSFNRDIGSTFPVRSTELLSHYSAELFRGFSSSVSGVIYSRIARKKRDLLSSRAKLPSANRVKARSFRGDPLRFPRGVPDEFSFSTDQPISSRRYRVLAKRALRLSNHSLSLLKFLQPVEASLKKVD